MMDLNESINFMMGNGKVGPLIINKMTTLNEDGTENIIYDKKKGIDKRTKKQKKICEVEDGKS